VAYVARWAEVASDQYWELAEPVRQLVDERVRNLTEVPDGPSCSFDPHTDHWTATAGDGRLMLVYVFRPEQPWLFILRLVVL
jgi:hypothetical protein